ncbi:MAG: hypothetical protein ABI835_08435, partial [Chloroflexota bacterium]
MLNLNWRIKIHSNFSVGQVSTPLETLSVSQSANVRKMPRNSLSSIIPLHPYTALSGGISLLVGRQMPDHST